MLEAALKDKKEETDRLEAPAEMETRLRQALQGKKRRTYYKPVAAVLIAALILSYSFDSLAYYGKKFTGYDQIAVGSLKKLNEEGRGQEINRSCTFSNGVTVTIDGIMFDGNELVAFYKVHSNDGKLLEVLDNKLPRLHAYGIKPLGYYFRGGQGISTDNWNMSFVDTLEPPQFYEKWMRLDVELIVGNKVEVKSIGFTLDRNKAMSRTAKMELNSEARLGDYRILFDRLTASAMSSVLEGRIIPENEAAFKVFKAHTAAESMKIPQLLFDIVSNSGEVSNFFGRSQGASDTNITFSNRSDSLPKNFKTLQIRNIRFETMEPVDKTVDVNMETKDLQVADDLTIKQVYQDSQDTCLAVSSRGVPVMGLFDGDKQLEQVNPGAYDREEESGKPVERIYRFKGTGGSLKLMVKYIKYTRYSTDTINIPVN